MPNFLGLILQAKVECLCEHAIVVVDKLEKEKYLNQPGIKMFYLLQTGYIHSC